MTVRFLLREQAERALKIAKSSSLSSERDEQTQEEHRIESLYISRMGNRPILYLELFLKGRNENENEIFAKTFRISVLQ